MGKKTTDKKDKVSFLNKTLRLFVSAFGMVALVAAFICALSPYINPSKFVVPAMFGLAFWFIFISNILTLIALLVLKAKKLLLIPLLGIILLIPGLIKSFAFEKSEEGYAEVKVMTFNACNFRDVINNQKKQQEVLNYFYTFLKEHDPDVLCLQEGGGWHKTRIDEFLKNTSFKYHSVNGGNAYFSKFPLKDVTSYNDENFTGFADLQKVMLDDDSYFYLVNCHFNSFQITKEEISYINDARNIIKESETHGKSVIVKLFKGFKERSESTELLLEKLPEGDYPLIICGDFNDTPLSYTYNKMAKYGLHDAFLRNSFGIGKTYSGSLPLLRIDYFWYNDLIQAVEYKRLGRISSDHFPLMLTFNILTEDEL